MIRLSSPALLLLILAAPLTAQETRGMVFGRVTDAQAGAVGQAPVTITNRDTGVRQNSETNLTGYYELNLLIPGNYLLTVGAPGFKKAVRSGVVVPVGGRVQVDLSLEIGAVTESISVNSESPLIETSSASAGQVMSTRSIEGLPALGNNPMLLVMLVPGMQAGGVNKYNSLHTLGGASDYSVAGKVGNNEWSIDGAPNSRGRSPSFLPAGDTVQEFRVETTTFDASIGHNTGANVSMMTKTGTNVLHGTASLQHWQQRWNGTPFFIRQQYFRDIAAAETAGNAGLANRLRSQDRQPSGRSNTYVGTIGGPVYLPKLFDGRNRLFFFLSFSGFTDRKRTDGPYLNRTVPTAEQLAGNFSSLLNVDPSRYQIYDPLSVRPDPARPANFVRTPIPGNIVPAARIINPAYKAYAGFLPKPNRNPADPRQEPLNNYIAVGLPLNWKYASITNRIDYNLSERNRFFVTWRHYGFTENHYDWTYESFPGLQNEGFVWGNDGGTANWVHMPNGATVLDISVSASSYTNTNALQVPFQFKPSDVGLPSYLDNKAGTLAMLPRMSFAGYETLSSTAPPWTRNQLSSARANISNVRGKHSLSAGADFRRYTTTGNRPGVTSGNFGFSNLYTRRYDDTLTPAGDLGHSWAAFMMGLPNTITIDTNDTLFIRSPLFGAFVQDNWRLSSRLTLNLGLRAEYEAGSSERLNRAIGGFDPSAALSISGAAQAAYAKAPVPELAPSAFQVRGGFGYLGVGSLDRRNINSAVMFLPRLGAAYQLGSRTVLRGGYGVYYDTLNAFNLGVDQFGFNRTTSTNVSDNFGQTWLVGDPRNGVSPLSNPFPVREDGTRFDTATRAALGAMAGAGRSMSFIDYNTQRARQQRWRAGLQRQLGASMVMEVAYSGSYSSQVNIPRNANPLPAQFWADGSTRNNTIASNLNANVTNPFQLANFSALASSDRALYTEMSRLGFFTSPITPKNLLLRPFPHMTGLTQNLAPVGAVKTHELQVSFERRFSKGFNLTAGYSAVWGRERDFFLNEFDPGPSWRESNSTRPQRFVATGVWELPFGKGRALVSHGFASHLVGGLQIAGSYEWQPGPLLNFGNLFFYGNLNDINSGTGTLDRWFNTDGFERVASKGPAAFHRRVFPTRISGLRQDMTNQLNATAQRDFKLGERLSFQARVDAINVTNRSQFDAPDMNPYSTNFGKIVQQTAASNRVLQIVGRFRF